MKEHITTCTACQMILQRNQNLSKAVRSFLLRESALASPEGTEQQILDWVQSRSIPWWWRLGHILRSRRFQTLAAASAAALIVLFSFWRHPTNMARPSAIVSSVKGNMDSVMILETKKSHKTVIWISEGFSNGETGEDQKIL